jgi:hypothetical protein
MILPKTLALSVQLIIPVAAADGVPQLKSKPPPQPPRGVPKGPTQAASL